MPSENAYVWVIFLGDRYIPGVLASAYSVKRTNTKYDLICLVTPDVSDIGRKELAKICTKVIEINYIRVKRQKFKTNRQKELYKTWMDVSYTKWNILNLTQYKKVFFLDGDTIITNNIDSVFDTKKISATFYNPWSNKYSKFSKIKDYYGRKKIINPNLILKALTKSGYVLIASAVLLYPNKDHFNKYKQMLKNKNIVDTFSKNNYSAHDEQSIAYFMSIYEHGPQLTWYNLPQCYQFIPWRRNECCDDKSIYYQRQKTKICPKISVIHYFGQHAPWELDFNSDNLFPDTHVWLSMCQEMLQQTKVNIKKINIKYPESIFKKINPNNKNFKVFTQETLPLFYTK
jgi:glycogenin glucosyltransferase